MFHDEGASTASTGMGDVANAEMTGGNGWRTSPVNENPATEGKRLRSKINAMRPLVACVDVHCHQTYRRWRQRRNRSP